MTFFGVSTTLLREDFAMIKEYFLFDSLNSIELFFRQLCLLRMFTNRYPNGVKEMILDSESILEKTKNLSQIIKAGSNIRNEITFISRYGFIKKYY